MALRRRPDHGASKSASRAMASICACRSVGTLATIRFWFGREAEIAVVDLRDAAQRRELRCGAVIEQPAVLHEQREMRLAGAGVAPAVAVAGRGEPERPSGRERHVGAPFDLGAEGIEPAILDGVFEPRVLAVVAVAPIALHGDDRLGDRHRILGLAKAHHVGGARIGVRLAMGHAHAAADRDVPAGDRSGSSTMAMKPRSCAKTSTSFDGGTATTILNLRGR